jgi:hypothetical protein
MADQQPDTLNVITTALAGGRGPDDWQRRRVEKDVLVTALTSGIDRFVDQMRAMALQALAKGRTLQGDDQQPDNADKHEELLLDEMVFHAEVSPEGEFKLLGSGVEMGEGGVKFVWRRKHIFGTAGLSKALLSSIVEKGELPNKLVAALVGSQEEGKPFNQANTLRALAALVGGPQGEDRLKQGNIDTNQHVQVDIPKPVQVEIINIVYTAIVDVVNVLLAGV